MRAAVLADVGRLEIRDVPATPPGPGEVLLRVAAVGLCGTDFHIYGGHGNYHTDDAGRPIPLTTTPQILGHELVGIVSELGAGVADLAVGDRVVADQGRNCVSVSRHPLCEYCITLPAANAITADADLPIEELALTEPLGCIVHSTDLLLKSATRYRLRDADPAHRVNTVVIFGGGPAGLLFTQYLRSGLGFEGVIVVSDPNPLKRSLAASMGATPVDPIAEDLATKVLELSGGRRAELVIDASGAGAVFKDMPRLLRKQGTVLLYGHGHVGVDMSALNNLQFLEPTLLSPVGASGGFEPDGRPSTYRRALGLLETGKVKVGAFITHRYRSLDEVPAAFAGAHEALDYVKGVVLLT